MTRELPNNSQSQLPRVLADGPLHSDILGLLDGRVSLVDWDVAKAPADAEPPAQDITGIYTFGHPTVDAAMLDRLRGVRVVSNYGVGVDHIDAAAASARDVSVGNTPGVLDGATADMGMALLLAAGRRLVEGDRYAHSPEFVRYDPCYMLGREVHHATLGIIGMGRIGGRVAHRARAFEMELIYHNRRRRDDDKHQFGASFVPLEELLGRSDYVMLTAPLTDQTRGMISARQLAMMRRTAFLINIARGPLVDLDALTMALYSGAIAGAALDVTEPEPLPRDHPLLRLQNVIITPHLGSATVETRRQMAQISVANLLAGLAGKPLEHAVRA